ncbi:MAG: hypothetical protein QGH26_03670 [Candidatus Pacebacteria bacterium]|nr:hypothetical protein [Candidatus Paceibacterota bacterium]
MATRYSQTAKHIKYALEVQVSYKEFDKFKRIRTENLLRLIVEI